VLEPDDPAIRDVLDDLSQHPELTLSRRDIIKDILRKQLALYPEWRT